VPFLVAAAVAAFACAFVAWRWAWSVGPLARWDDDLDEALAQARDDRERVAAVNELLADAEHRLVAGERLPRSAAFIAVVATALCLVAGALREPTFVLLACVPIALAGAAACIAAGRAGRRRADAERRRVDALVAARVGALYEAEVEVPRRGARRRRRR
jgi:hypothetical protein